MAYSFAAAFRTEPVLTYIRDELGSDYLRIFDLDWHPQGVLTPSGALGAGDWKDLGALARLSQQALEDAGLPQFEGQQRLGRRRQPHRQRQACWPATRISASPRRRYGTRPS